ncbi:MAG: membrane dipeptidase [Clostridia bacterium]|nr:membrane dipeptidase [Clostridia bacterium]
MEVKIHKICHVGDFLRYFDLHCDTARVCYKKNLYPDDLSLAVSTANGNIFERWRQCYAVFIPDDSPDPEDEYAGILGGFIKKISGIPRIEPIFTLENGVPIKNVEFVERLSYDGIKAVTLTWNGENSIAGGVYSDAGLKPFGKQVIYKLNDKNIACDLSHLNEKSFFEAGDTAKIIFASHTCCDRTHHHPRNLSDRQLKYIAARGGVIGVCFYPEFLGTKYAYTGVWRHINHLLNLGLEKSVCIGSDFDGAQMSEQLDGIGRIPALYEYLLSSGIHESTLDLIFYKNAEKFFENF